MTIKLFSFKSITLCLVLVVSTAFATHSVTSQDADAQGGGDDMEEMMAMMMAGQPGEHHKGLAQSAGSWDIDSKHWTDAAMPPMDAKASSEVKMIMGGRFMHEVFKMDFMGMPFEGNLILGYNNVTEQYESVWFDNMTSGMMTSTGEGDGKGNIEFHGIMKDLRTPEGRPYRMSTSHNDDGTMAFQMYDTAEDGSEYMTMDNTYTRR
jgi:hypothetical protein